MSSGSPLAAPAKEPILSRNAADWAESRVLYRRYFSLGQIIGIVSSGIAMLLPVVFCPVQPVEP
jgi:hypothetical protein